MIRLTINAQSDPEIHLFNKNEILLGSDPNCVDLVLDGHEIQPIHLKIVEQGGFLILINQASDPFVSLNGQPFGKKLLNSGDVIHVHHNEILFENLSTQPDSHQKKEGSPPTNMEAPFSKPGANEKKIEKREASSALNEKASLKDDYLRDLEDDNQSQQNQVHALPDGHLKQAWKWVIMIIFSLLSLAIITGSLVYFTASDKADANETKATQAVADIAMALTHAKLFHLKPTNQNWSDVDFLKNNLHHVLPNTTSYANYLDVQGQLNCCPYSLRIYTNGDFSHFLLIAQPSPSLLHWLIPKSIIVVDSTTMELRSLKEVRSLNRLLANTDPLEGTNAKEISAVIKEGSLIPLSSLANDARKMDFAPPILVKEVKAGAENIIYNAPRYYRLSQGLKNKILALQEGKGNAQEVTALKQDVEQFSCLSPFILYDSDGKKSALMTRKGLNLFVPAHKFLIGYLNLNNEGKIEEVELVTELEEGEPIAYQNPEESNPTTQELASHEEIDFNHPIYIQLQALTMARENELKPIYASLTQLLHQDLQKPSPTFHSDYLKKMHQALKIDYKHKQQIKEVFDLLYHQYGDMPFHQFLAYVKHLRLEMLIEEESERLVPVDESSVQNIENFLTHINKAKSLGELDNLILLSSSWLNLDYLKNSDEIIKYENLLRNQLLMQLEKYLLTDPQLLKKEDKPILESLLSHEKLIKEEEKIFFINEFDAFFISDTEN